ncbi:MAG: DUF881 domain-containing protein [Armatimonadota bacterium]|nr:DUF881 domain-containing protein [Armatimonadota bacterium]
MNATNSYPAAGPARAPRPGSRKTWLVSLTAICFLFGGLLAVQLRAMQQVSKNRVQNKAELEVANARMASLKDEYIRATNARKQAEARIAILEQAAKGGLPPAQAKQLMAQVKELQRIAGLTLVSGPGVLIIMKDNPAAGDAGDANPFLPGVVHDYDLLQVVNELRAAQADAIAINGRRITGYTPIRCVGPVIYIDGEGVAPPFRIQAIGDPDRLLAALEMPNGIVANLKRNTLDVRISRADNLNLPAGAGVPHFRVAKSR